MTMTTDTRRRFAARVLLAVMLAMLVAVPLHRHEDVSPLVEQTCQDCLHHVHHAPHLTGATATIHDCVLCQLQSMPFLMAASVAWTAIALTSAADSTVWSAPCLVRPVDSKSPRAPPYLD